jgi:hypothetical protein
MSDCHVVFALLIVLSLVAFAAAVSAVGLVMDTISQWRKDRW